MPLTNINSANSGTEKGELDKLEGYPNGTLDYTIRSQPSIPRSQSTTTPQSAHNLWMDNLI